MKCQTIADRLSEFLDLRLPEQEHLEVSRHLESCIRCGIQCQEMRRMRMSLRALPVKPVPAYLTTSLRVIASREHARASAGNRFQATLRRLCEKGELMVANLMRPLAIPFAGGLCSAMLLFGMLLPTFALRSNSAIADVPITLYRSASVKSSLFGASIDEVLLDVNIDGQGRVIDYKVVSGQHWMEDHGVRSMIENNLLFVQFTPATTFGRPTYGRVRLSFRPGTHVDVKG